MCNTNEVGRVIAIYRACTRMGAFREEMEKASRIFHVGCI
jgi:hypothetical protein